MTSLRRILVSGAILVAASGFALANDIELYQTASGGTLSPVTAPPGVSSPDASVTGFSQSAAVTAAQNWVSSNCPIGDVCTFQSVSFNAVDIGYSINLGQTVTLDNTNGTSVQTNCIAGNCTGTAANVGQGVAFQGTANLQIDDGLYGSYSAGPPATDPSQGDIITKSNIGVFNVSTNTATNCSANPPFFCTYVETLQTGNNAFSSPADYILSASLTPYYQSTDPNWANESSYYSQSVVPFTVYSLSGGVTGNLPTGVSGSTSVSLDTGSTMNVSYGYDVNFTEYNPSVTPEPGTMALLGGALIGLGLIGKKGFRKS